MLLAAASNGMLDWWTGCWIAAVLPLDKGDAASKRRQLELTSASLALTRPGNSWLAFDS